MIGNPVLIQSRFGTQGNFEVIVAEPSCQGCLNTYFRNNDDLSFPWSRISKFGNDRYESMTMIQSNFGNPGNLEVVCRIGDKLVFFWRDSGPAFNWNGPFQFS